MNITSIVSGAGQKGHFVIHRCATWAFCQL